MAKSFRFAVGIITRLAPESIATRSLDVVTDLETLDKVLPYYPTGKDFEEFLIQGIINFLLYIFQNAKKIWQCFSVAIPIIWTQNLFKVIVLG